MGLQKFSSDSRYLVLFPKNVTYMLAYDRDLNWSQVANVSLGFTTIQDCMDLKETNNILCIGGPNNILFTINFYDFSFSIVRTELEGNKLKAS